MPVSVRLKFPSMLKFSPVTKTGLATGRSTRWTSAHKTDKRHLTKARYLEAELFFVCVLASINLRTYFYSFYLVALSPCSSSPMR